MTKTTHNSTNEMKRLKTFSAALTVALAAVGCGNSNGYTIKGSLTPNEEFRYDSVMVMVGDVRNAVAVNDNQFVLEGVVEAPVMTQLDVSYVNPESGMLVGNVTIPVVVEPGKIVVSGDQESSTVGGTPQNDAIQAFNDAIEEWELREGEWEEVVGIVKEFIATNSQNQAAVYGITIGQNALEDAELAEAMNACAEQVRQHPDIVPIVERMAIIESTSEGKPFVDFEVEGKKLSDYVGKGQVVLVDFWASWCGPCRAEIPNIKKVYEQYKGQGLVVVGVPTSDRPEDTLKAVEEDSIPFPQLMGSERQAIGARTYGVRGIPHLVLFGADGTILARGIRGEAVATAVAEALK